MSSSSTSSTSGLIRRPRLFKVDLDGNVYCHHDILAVVRVAGLKSQRHGEEFYGCSHWPRGDCKFFLWKQDVDNMFLERSYGTSTTVTFKDMKIKNLELQNQLLIEENNNLKAMRCDPKMKSKKLYVLSFLIASAILLYLWN
ncbi:putative transcription factor GRF family [Helianthus annuus]|nr:putative transcription factor GRF family [Helianthus annuus]KAJ0690879.1 putative transcription factor GRF family [Helianthus annuus]KAJ0872540.1 putative transcription factor GRF family [Helianthus annuus]